jgi:hypothetical protein
MVHVHLSRLGCLRFHGLEFSVTARNLLLNARVVIVQLKSFEVYDKLGCGSVFAYYRTRELIESANVTWLWPLWLEPLYLDVQEGVQKTAQTINRIIGIESDLFSSFSILRYHSSSVAATWPRHFLR